MIDYFKQMKENFTDESAFFLLIVLLLSFLGFAEMISAYSHNAGSVLSLLLPGGKFFFQIFSIIIGFIIFLAISNSRLNSKVEHISGLKIFLIGFAVLVLQFLVRFGTARNGAQRWLPFFSCQPSEIIPIYAVVAFAWARIHYEDKLFRCLIYIILCCCLVAVLFAQNNLSTALVYLAGFALIFFQFMFEDRFKENHIVLWQRIIFVFLLIIIISVPVAIHFNHAGGKADKIGADLSEKKSFTKSFSSDNINALFLGHFRKERIENWAYYDAPLSLPISENWRKGIALKYKYQHRFRQYINDKGAQPINAKTAIIKGGLKGYGFNKNEVNNRNKISISHSDYIFAIIAAEIGFLWTSAIFILLIAAMLWYWHKISKKTETLEYKYPATRHFAVCSMIMLAVQSLAHIWVNLSMLPSTGLPLPLFSHGGSNLLSSFVLLGFMLGALNKENVEERN